MKTKWTVMALIMILLWAVCGSSAALEDSVVPALGRTGFSADERDGEGALDLHDTAIYAKTGTGLIASGVWGNLSWNLDQNGMLTVSGTGEMPPFETLPCDDAWHAY